jgi:hypothetical protein
MEDTLESIARQADQLRAAHLQRAEAVRVPRRELVDHRNALEYHKWFLSERLGRDVGL